MPTHSETRQLPYTSEQMFDLVADIEKYPEFLPWCLGARVTHSGPDKVVADVIIGFKMFRESFTTTDMLDRPNRIDVSYTRGPFKYLKNHWIFTPAKDGGCQIDFFVDFEFRSRLLGGAMGLVFEEAVRRMVSAFDNRAAVLYGRRQANSRYPG